MATHPFLQAAQDLEARGWAAQKEAAKAADANDVLGAAVRPLQVQARLAVCEALVQKSVT